MTVIKYAQAVAMQCISQVGTAGRIIDKFNFRKTKQQEFFFISYLQQAPISKSVAYQFVQMHQTLMVADMVGEDREHHCMLKNNCNKEKHSTSVCRVLN